MLLWVCDGLTLDSRKRACEELQVRTGQQFHMTTACSDADGFCCQLIRASELLDPNVLIIS